MKSEKKKLKDVMINFICMLFGHRIIDKNNFFKYKKTKICTAKCDRCKENLVGAVEPKYQNMKKKKLKKYLDLMQQVAVKWRFKSNRLKDKLRKLETELKETKQAVNNYRIRLFEKIKND